MISQQPIAAMINTPDCFKHYGGDIITEKSCKCEANGFTHSVTIVGYVGTPDEITGCQGYWIV